MANENNENQELDTNLEEDIDLELEEEEDAPKAEIDWKSVAKRYKKKADKQSKPTAKEDTSGVRAELARLELKTDGYSEDAITFLMKVGGKEALKDAHIKAAIDSIQEQKRAEDAVVASETSKSDVERKFTQQEIDAMSPEELYKILPKAKK